MSKRGENIYQRKDRRWEARYMKGRAADGSIRYGYCYGKTYREAKEKVTLAKISMRDNQSAQKKQNCRLFSVYCDEWLRVNRNRFKESTYVKYMTILEKHIKPGVGDCFVQELSSIVIEQFTYELLNEKGLSPKSVKDILTVLRSVLCYTSRQLPSALAGIEIVYPKDVKKEIRILSREEQFRFTQYLFADMDECKLGILLALLTGLRIGELCALKWKDISIKDKILHVSSTMQRLKNLDQSQRARTKIVISEPKSLQSERDIPLTDYIVNLCNEWISENSAAYVLTGDESHYMEPRALQYRLKRYVQECGLEDIHFHALRHTFATRCVEVGFEIKSLSEILGHANPKFTLDRYVHSSLELKRENMEKLSQIGY